MEIDVLARQGKGIREIARMTGLARNTVREVVRGHSDGQYGPRLPRSTKLDDHKAYITDRIERAGVQRLAATVLLRKLRGRGYDGGITLSYVASGQRHCRSRSCGSRRRPANRCRPILLSSGVARYPLEPLRPNLPRYSFVEFTDNERADTLIACLERAPHCSTACSITVTF